MILTQEDVAASLAALAELDPTLGPIMAIAGEVPLRQGARGLRGLAGIVTAQQVSKASADAIFARLSAEIDLDDAGAVLQATPEAFRRAGMSRGKERTLLALAQAVQAGELDLVRIARIAPDAAIAELVAVPGIGPWTAQCYLLFCAGHPDIFPAGDLALQIACGHGIGGGERMKEKALILRAQAWRLHRSVAARLFWAYYAAMARQAPAPTIVGPPA